MSPSSPSMKKGCTSTGGWSNLHQDLLIEIFRRLESVDLIRSRAVCGPWRSVPAETPRKDVWMMPSNSDKPGRHCFYSLNNLLSIKQQGHKLAAATKYFINLPQIAGRHRYLGSSQGFLITFDVDTLNLSAVNPLTGAHFPLPPTAAPPDIYTFDCRNMSWIRGATFHKAIISPSLDTIVVAVSGVMLDENVSGRIVNFKNITFAKAGDDSWTNVMNLLIDDIFDRIMDIIFHKGRLYVLHFYNRLNIIDLQSPNILPLLYVWPRPRSLTKYLAETPDHKDLLLLCEVVTSEETTRKPAVKKLEVCKLARSKLEFNLVNDLGDVALFFGGTDDLFSLSTREFTNLNSNCIYVTPNAYIKWLDQREDDIGVYDLKDGTVRPLSADGDLRGLCHPIWFAPSL